MMKTDVRPIELLAPARDAEIAIEAIAHGADAVYMGPSSHGARALAGNSTSDMARVARFAHQFGVRLYATVNTLVYDHELKQVERLIRDLYGAGVDAIIVQDLGILRMDLPPIALHASTQCDVRTPEKAQFLASLGFSRIVLPRELTLSEIEAMRAAVPSMPLEGFVHGALCVSYSGRCQVSQCLKGRSANRGECAQMCRLAYDLEDAEGRKLVKNKHLLSLRDLNASDYLMGMMEAGISSLKIEGRLKDMAYVKNVVAYYRQRLDSVMAGRGGQYCRSSWGESAFTFTPDVSKSFNRSFTTYFLDGHVKRDGHKMASIDTPKSLGEPLGTVLEVKGKAVRLDTQAQVANGDGLSYFDLNGAYTGFRVNRVQGRWLMLKDAMPIPRGARVCRTHDKAFGDLLAKPSADRRVSVDARLWTAGSLLCLQLQDERGNRVTHSIDVQPLDEAQSPQDEQQKSALAKLGNTIYQLTHAEVTGSKFIPNSALTRLRRETIERLDRAQLITFQRETRRQEDLSSQCPVSELTCADNVANRLAEQLYRDHGVCRIEPALEVRQPARDVPVMHTRYCLRRELACCKKDPQARSFPDPLYLSSNGVRLRVECDCRNCEMKLYVS